MRNLLQRRSSNAQVAHTTTQASATSNTTTMTTTTTTTRASLNTPEMAERSGIVPRQRPPTVIVDIPSATLAWEEYESQRELANLAITNASGNEATVVDSTTTEALPSISEPRPVENRPPPLQLSRAPTYHSTAGANESKPSPFKRSCFRYPKQYVGSAIIFVMILATIGLFVVLKTKTQLDFPGLLIIFLAILAVLVGIWLEVTFKITGRMDPEPIDDDTEARLEWEFRNQQDEARPAANRDFAVQVDEIDGQQIVTSPTFPPPAADYMPSPPSSPHSLRLQNNRSSRTSFLPSRARSRTRASRLPPGVVAPWNRPEYQMELYTQRVPRLDGMGGDEAILVPLNRPPPPAYKARLRDGSRYVEAQTGLVRTLSQTQQRDRRVAGRLTLLETRRQPLANDLERINSNTSVASRITTQEQDLPDEHIPYEQEKNMTAIMSALPPSPGSPDNTSTDV